MPLLQVTYQPRLPTTCTQVTVWYYHVNIDCRSTAVYNRKLHSYLCEELVELAAGQKICPQNRCHYTFPISSFILFCIEEVVPSEDEVHILFSICCSHQKCLLLQFSLPIHHKIYMCPDLGGHSATCIILWKYLKSSKGNWLLSRIFTFTYIQFVHFSSCQFKGKIIPVWVFSFKWSGFCSLEAS